MRIVWIYTDTSKQVVDVGYLKAFGEAPSFRPLDRDNRSGRRGKLPAIGDDPVGMIRFGLFGRGPTEAATTASTTGSTPPIRRIKKWAVALMSRIFRAKSFTGYARTWNQMRSQKATGVGDLQ